MFCFVIFSAAARAVFCSTVAGLSIKLLQYKTRFLRQQPAAAETGQNNRKNRGENNRVT